MEGFSRVREVKNDKRWEGVLVHVKPIWVCNWYLSKLGSSPPTGAGRQGPYLQVLAGTVHSLGSLEFSQAGTLRWGLGGGG